MRKFLMMAVMLLFPALAWGQNTTVTATVKDPSGFAYAFSTGYAALVCPGNQAPTFNGYSMPRTFTITGFDGTGTFTQVLYDVSQIQPTGCGYQWHITYKDGVTSFITGSITAVSGSSVNLSTAISAYAVPLPVVPTGGTISGSISSPQVAYGASANAITGDAGLTYVAAPTPFLFTGAPNSGLSANLQSLITGVGGPIGFQSNRHIAASSTDTATLGQLGVFEDDKDDASDGAVFLSDFTNLPTQAVAGGGFEMYLNIPIAQTNTNSLGAENSEVFYYGLGTATELTAHYGFIGNISTGTVNTAVGYEGIPVRNLAGGTIHNSFGFEAEDMNPGNVATNGDTLIAAFMAQPQTAGSNNFAFYNDTGISHFDVGTFKTSVTSPYFSTATANPAVSGLARLASADQICWRNNANNGDLCISKSTGDVFTLPGATIIAGATSITAFLTTESIQPDLAGTRDIGFASLPYDSIFLGGNSNQATGLSSNATAVRAAAFPDASGPISLGSTSSVITSDWSCGTGGTVASCTTAHTIGGLTFTLPLAVQNWSIDCNLVVGQATGATANSWNIQTATNGAVNLTANYLMATAATAMAGGAVTDVAATTTTQVITPTWTLGGTATQMPVHIWGDIEGSSVSGTVLNIQLVAPTVADLVTIYRGSSCHIY